MQPILSALNNASAFDPNYYDPTHAATVNAAGIITSNPYPYNGLVLPGTGLPAQAQGRVSVVNNPQVSPSSTISRSAWSIPIGTLKHLA